MDNVTSFVAGVVLGILAAAVYGIFREAGRLDRMDEPWIREQRRMQIRDDRRNI